VSIAYIINLKNTDKYRGAGAITQDSIEGFIINLFKTMSICDNRAKIIIIPIKKSFKKYIQ
jgi:hypothetical protein